MSESKILENRLALLENTVMSLNTLWKMAIIVQGPKFTESLIANLANALLSNPSDPVFRDAKDGLENAMKAWQDHTGGTFGWEHLEDRIEVLQARYQLLDSVLFLHLLQQGPHSLRPILQALKNKKGMQAEGLSKTFVDESDRFLDEYRDRLEKVLKMFSELDEKEEVAHA